MRKLKEEGKTVWMVEAWWQKTIYCVGIFYAWLNLTAFVFGFLNGLGVL